MWSEHVAIISSDESSSSDSDAEVSNDFAGQQSNISTPMSQPVKVMTPEDALIKRAEMYQEYMKQIPIPTKRSSIIPFTTWVGLGTSIKQLYGQPLHCLTNILLKQWDQSRFGTEDEHEQLDTIVHPCKAEATIWLIEEVHRRVTSHHQVARVWQSDPMHHAFVDSIFFNSTIPPPLHSGS